MHVPGAREGGGVDERHPQHAGLAGEATGSGSRGQAGRRRALLAAMAAAMREAARADHAELAEDLRASLSPVEDLMVSVPLLRRNALEVLAALLCLEQHAPTTTSSSGEEVMGGGDGGGGMFSCGRAVQTLSLARLVQLLWAHGIMRLVTLAPGGSE